MSSIIFLYLLIAVHAMILREATIHDFKQLKELKKEFFQWECSQDPDLDPSWTKRTLGIRLGKNLRQKNIAFFLALDEGKAIGYVGVEIYKAPSQYIPKRESHIFNLYVRPAFQNRGIGRKLLQRALSWAKGKKVNCIKIMHFSNNKIAQKLYAGHGFVEEVRVMWLSL
ncbi:MAG: GNAT family N-acetyltransferase [Nanoarchaeota archaeon]